MVLVMEKGMADKMAVGRCVQCSTDEVHLSSGNHVADTRYVIEHAPHVLVSDVFFFNLEH